MLRFRLFNIPFAVGIYFLIGSALLGQGAAVGPNASLLLLIWIACVFISITVHELGHALAARHYGVEPTIELQAFGGLTRMFGRTLTRFEGFWVTFCGPAAGFALYLAASLVQRWIHPEAGVDRLLDPTMTPALATGAALDFLLWINFWWTVFNLLPILPLDGGQMLRNLLGPRNLKLTETVGVVLAGVLAVLMAFHGRWYPAALLGYLAYVNFRGNSRALPGGPGL